MTTSTRQHTLAEAIHFEGIGLHTGKRAKLTIVPGDCNAGYVFVRKDLQGEPSIVAHVSNVGETTRGTMLQVGDATVYTTEHVLAALYASGIDNAILELDGSVDGAASNRQECVHIRSDPDCALRVGTD